MLQNAYFLAKIGADTAENEQDFAENLPKIGNYPTGPPRCARLPTGGPSWSAAAPARLCPRAAPFAASALTFDVWQACKSEHKYQNMMKHDI